VTSLRSSARGARPQCWMYQILNLIKTVFELISKRREDSGQYGKQWSFDEKEIYANSDKISKQRHGRDFLCPHGTLLQQIHCAKSQIFRPEFAGIRISARRVDRNVLTYSITADSKYTWNILLRPSAYSGSLNSARDCAS